MTRRSGGFRGAKPTWTTTSTSGVFGMEDVVDLKAANQWPRGPVAPTSLAGTGGDGQVALTWAAPATTHGTITDYVVEYTPAAGSPTVVATGSTAASYTLTGLTNDTEYTFRVAAVNHTRGDWSDSVAVTPSAVVGDPDFASVSLLLHMDGSNGSTTFTDSSSNAITVSRVGNAQISTTQSKFGGASGYFDGSGDYLETGTNADFNFGTGDFTIEAWVRLDSLNAERAIAAKWGPSSTEWLFRVESNNRLKLFAGNGAVTGASPLSSGVWHHAAVTRSGGTVRLFLDGNQNASGTVSDNLTGNNSVTVGDYLPFAGQPGVNPWLGYIDDLRITKGVARYTANFTPPTDAFPDQ